MSYILDALRKSEQERGASTEPRPEPVTPAPAPKRAWGLLAFAAFVTLTGLVGVLLWWRSEPQAPVTETSAAVPPPSKVAARDLEQELAAPPAQAQTRAPVPAPPPVAVRPIALDPASVPYLREMPDEFQRALPALNMDIHVFVPGGGRSILYLNSREYRPGESVQPGLRVEAIVQEGAVLSYNGQLFKLPRPH